MRGELGGHLTTIKRLQLQLSSLEGVDSRLEQALAQIHELEAKAEAAGALRQEVQVYQKQVGWLAAWGAGAVGGRVPEAVGVQSGGVGV